MFHAALVGVLVAVGLGGGFAYTGQRVIVEGTTFVNTLLDYSSMNRGRFVSEGALPPYAMTLDSFDVTYQPIGSNAEGQAGDFSANVTVRMPDGATSDGAVRVNHPLDIAGDKIYLLGNGYAPTIVIRNAQGEVVFDESVPFLPQDSLMTSLGVVKVPDGMPEQLGMVGFFYPDAGGAGDRGVRLRLSRPHQSVADAERLRGRPRHRRRNPALGVRARSRRDDAAHGRRDRRRLDRARAGTDGRPAERARHHHVRRRDARRSPRPATGSP